MELLVYSVSEQAGSNRPFFIKGKKTGMSATIRGVLVAVAGRRELQIERFSSRSCLSSEARRDSAAGKVRISGDSDVEGQAGGW